MEKDNLSPTFHSLPLGDITQLDGGDEWSEINTTTTNNCFYILQGNSLSGLTLSEQSCNILQSGFDSSRQPNLGEIAEQQCDPWNQAVSMRHCGTIPIKDTTREVKVKKLVSSVRWSTKSRTSTISTSVVTIITMLGNCSTQLGLV